MTTERELLVDCLHRLNRLGLAYMLTGSMASNYWGIPRTTHDLDFVIQLPVPAVPALIAEFSHSFVIQEASVQAAYSPPHQFNAIDTRSGLKVDFWMLRQVPFEQEMFARRVGNVLFGTPTWIATAEDVILHKLYWNQLTPSERQLSDAAGVVAVQGDGLDLEYLHRWAAGLDVAATLNELLSGKIRPKRT